MIHFEFEKLCKDKPFWLLGVMAFFPFDRSKSYPDEERPALINGVMDYLREFKYKKRNAIQCLGVTHSFEETEDSITIKTINDVPYLTIRLVTTEE